MDKIETKYLNVKKNRENGIQNIYILTILNFSSEFSTLKK